MQTAVTAHYCVFEYMYRDAGNWKTYGVMLLAEQAMEHREAVRACCEWGVLFVAEQIKVPSLCTEHWTNYSDEPSELDHAFHEFVDLRPATEEEVATMMVADTSTALLKRMQAAAGRWNVQLSPNCLL